MVINSFLNLISRNNDDDSTDSGQSGLSSDTSTLEMNTIDRSQRGWSWVPDWQKIFGKQWKEWQSYLQDAKGKKILIASMVSNSALSPLESLLCVALTLRGANVEILICDGILPACMNTTGPDEESRKSFVKNGPPSCDWCFTSHKGCYEQLGVKVHQLSNLLTEKQLLEAEELSKKLSLEEIKSYEEEGLPIGEHALAGTLRFFARGDLEDEPHNEDVLRRYFCASLITARAMQKCHQLFAFEHTLVNHGIYVPAGIVVACAKNYNSKVTTFTTGYKKRTVIFSHDDTYHHTLMDEHIDAWNQMAWNKELSGTIEDYLKSRWYGTNDWIYFHDENPRVKREEIEAEIGIDFSKPTIGLLTNVVWDAQLHYPANAFENMIEWIEKTVDYFGNRKDLQLLIRVHPAEIRGFVKSRQKVVDELNRRFQELPENIYVIPPESPLSTYVAMENCNSVIIYGTKTGLELTSMGIPTIVAGEAWIRNKGLTQDANNQEDYFNILDQLPLQEARLSEEQKTKAKMYAYHYFFRRMIPLNVINPEADKEFPMEILPVGIDGFLPGADKGIDTICDGILKGTPYIYRAEEQVVK